jgi:hypothetical protein
MTEARRINASLNITGVNIPDDIGDADRPTPLLFTVARADYTKPELADEITLEVEGGTCHCSCFGSSGSGHGGCCACTGSSGMGN